MEGRLKRVDINDVERLLYPTIPALVTSRSGDRIGGMLAACGHSSLLNPSS